MQIGTICKLYQLPRNSHYRIVAFPEKKYLLGHVDGSYSVSYNEEGDLVHISATIEVEKV